MQVIVNINGRDALPVRSLPFVAGFGELSPDVVALAAHGASPHFDHERTLATYRVEAGAIERFPSPQWSFIADRIDSLSRQLRAGVRDAKETRATWQAESIKLLPESAFVWLDQFEDWFCRTRALPINEDGSLDATESATLDLHAWVPPELRPVVMEGFIHPITTADAEQLIGWCDATLNAATWWSLSSVTAQEAAALLCRFNPNDEQDNPLEITTDETNPNDFKLLKRVLEDVERSIPQSRTLADWLAVAHEKRLKHHSWANGYEKARQALQAADASETSESTIVVEGRKALPLRLLPFVGRWEWMTSPDGIAHACSLPAKKLHAASGLEVRDREALKSFVFQGEKWREITTEEWDFFKVELDSLTKTLKADERGEHEDNKNFAAWRRQALEKLPARAFVWLDDFQEWFSATRPLKNCANTGHDDELEETFEKESDVLTLSPIIPNDLYVLVFEGFSRSPVRSDGPDALLAQRAEADCAQTGLEQKDPDQASALSPAFNIPLATEEVNVDCDAALAELFDPVAVPQLEAMFPDDGRWKGYAERADRNGLKEAAKVGRAKFNPYRAANWWLSRGPQSWKLERCLRVLANNLPPRSRDSKHLLTDHLD